MKNTAHHQKGFAFIAVIVVVGLAVGGLLMYRAFNKVAPGQKSSSGSSGRSFFSNFIRQEKTKPVKTILGVKTAKTLDAKTGQAGVVASVFSTKDPDIFVVLNVNKPIKGTKFEYVRYYNGKFVDNKSLTTTKDGVEYVSFNWGLKTKTSKHLAGEYKVKLYTNGNFEKGILYSIK